ncbi:NifU family protein [Krasilnikovia sp. MM14-A1259]|uniref:NifU family protein n=1 Tax=Krasilnikovia sp. MM14-A1259 TaxID=3373539 RepID=UPI0038057A69
MVPLHPQRCPGEPGRVRWIVPAGVLPGAGAPAAVPAPLAALRADGTLTDIRLEPAAVLTRLAPGRHWSTEGPRIRTAIHAALDDPAGWRVTPGPDGDAGLRAVVRDLLDGPVGRFARSHGGRIDLVDVRDGVVTVRLAGACRGCPAARSTLHGRLERLLRQRCPAVRAVVDAA